MQNSSSKQTYTSLFIVRLCMSMVHEAAQHHSTSQARPQVVDAIAICQWVSLAPRFWGAHHQQRQRNINNINDNIIAITSRRDM